MAGQALAPGVGRPGIGDWFPALGAWMQGNRTKAAQPMLDAGLERATGLLGAAPVQQPSRGPGGMIDPRQTGGSGLLADPDDFGNQMKFALGLMATPGYGALGSSSAQQAMQTQLGMPFKLMQERIKQGQWQAEQNLMRGDRKGLQGQYQDQAQYNLGVNAMRDDYEKLVQPFRQSGQLLNGIQLLVGQKGTTGMNIVDDEQMIKSYAKMLLPNEAVMTDDIQRIATSDSIDSVLRSIAGKVGGGIKLTAQERANLYDAMVRMGSEHAGQYNQLRDDYAGRAARAGFNNEDVMRTVYDIDTSKQQVSRGSGGRLLPPGMESTGERASGEQLERLKARNPEKSWWEW